jgi:hypothetical protein
MPACAYLISSLTSAWSAEHAVPIKAPPKRRLETPRTIFREQPSEAYCSVFENAILAKGVSFADSYNIVECSNCRRSNARNDPSAPTETKMSEDSGSQDLYNCKPSPQLMRRLKGSSQVVYRPIVRNQLSDRFGRFDIPQSGGSIYRARHNALGRNAVPCKGCYWRQTKRWALALTM